MFLNAGDSFSSAIDQLYTDCKSGGFRAFCSFGETAFKDEFFFTTYKMPNMQQELGFSF